MDPRFAPSDAPAFGPATALPQQFRLERALNGQVAMAHSRWRHWRGGRWASRYPHLGDQRFEFVLDVPPGVAGPQWVRVHVRLDPWVSGARCHTPSFDNAVFVQELTAAGAPGRTWRATRSIGDISLGADGVSGAFRRLYLRADEAPRDRSRYVILDGAWRAA